MIRLFYGAMNSEASKIKADKSIFTITDGIVQHMLAEHLFKGKFLNIVGEESSPVNITTRPYTVDDLHVPAEFEGKIDEVLAAIRKLATAIDQKAYKSNTVFIDPIDGTREFATGKGEQCTILIGFSDKSGSPCAGMCYRPIPNPSTFAGGCLSEKYVNEKLDMAPVPNLKGLLASNQVISPFLTELINVLKYERVSSGGAGNKMLMLMEGKGAAYIQDRGLSRWDTCAAQAVFEAKGGKLMKLLPYVSKHKKEFYHYLKSDYNLDFKPDTAYLTVFNSRVKSIKKDDVPKKAKNVQEVITYQNMMGLYAVVSQSKELEAEIYKGLMAAKKIAEPSFD